MGMLPGARPQMTRNQVMGMIGAAGLDGLLRLEDKVLIVGVRGYYRDTMGAPGKNDRGIYDDAIFIVSERQFLAFNANTDPSRFRAGSGKGAGKGMAVLKPGLHRAHRFGMHKAGKPTGHAALVQHGGAVTVRRDGQPPYDDTGYFGINIHRGGLNGTSSEGCQTLPPTQWAAFYEAVRAEAKHYFGANWGTTTIPYVLLEQS